MIVTCDTFKVEHLAALRLQPSQAGDVDAVGLGSLKSLEGPLAFTGMLEGRPIGCAGIVITELGIGTMWAFLGVDAGPHMLRLTRAGRRMIALAGVRRIEANTPCDFFPGCRWLALLGFQVEGAMRKYGADGRDHFLYARVA